MESVEKMESESILFVCPHCYVSVADLPKHLILHGYKMCNACETDISEKRSFEWKKGGGALKSHWNSRHKSDIEEVHLPIDSHRQCSPLQIALDVRSNLACGQIHQIVD